eukprot:TRINITY_DN1295_c0_g2_i1.p2 TRINITY_DN1295_c0_g2~~TRINITY_DN1295_c0_g2_i1.p2  ORF type:complete len:159 (+),score=21.94 TRINITY_DN1295_c0_g2_i1:37-513(+)
MGPCMGKDKREEEIEKSASRTEGLVKMGDGPCGVVSFDRIAEVRSLPGEGFVPCEGRKHRGGRAYTEFMTSDTRKFKQFAWRHRLEIDLDCLASPLARLPRPRTATAPPRPAPAITGGTAQHRQQKLPVTRPRRASLCKKAAPGPAAPPQDDATMRRL